MNSLSNGNSMKTNVFEKGRSLFLIHRGFKLLC